MNRSHLPLLLMLLLLMSLVLLAPPATHSARAQDTGPSSSGAAAALKANLADAMRINNALARVIERGQKLAPQGYGFQELLPFQGGYVQRGDNLAVTVRLLEGRHYVLLAAADSKTDRDRVSLKVTTMDNTKPLGKYEFGKGNAVAEFTPNGSGTYRIIIGVEGTSNADDGAFCAIALMVQGKDSISTTSLEAAYLGMLKKFSEMSRTMADDDASARFFRKGWAIYGSMLQSGKADTITRSLPPGTYAFVSVGDHHSSDVNFRLYDMNNKVLAQGKDKGSYSFATYSTDAEQKDARYKMEVENAYSDGRSLIVTAVLELQSEEWALGKQMMTAVDRALQDALACQRDQSYGFLDVGVYACTYLLPGTEITESYSLKGGVTYRFFAAADRTGAPVAFRITRDKLSTTDRLPNVDGTGRLDTTFTPAATDRYLIHMAMPKGSGDEKGAFFALATMQSGGEGATRIADADFQTAKANVLASCRILMKSISRDKELFPNVLNKNWCVAAVWLKSGSSVIWDAKPLVEGDYLFFLTGASEKARVGAALIPTGSDTSIKEGKRESGLSVFNFASKGGDYSLRLDGVTGTDNTLAVGVGLIVAPKK